VETRQGCARSVDLRSNELPLWYERWLLGGMAVNSAAKEFADVCFLGDAMLRYKAISPIKLNEGRMRLEMLNGLRKTGTRIKEQYDKTTRTWRNKPRFEQTISLRGSSPSILVATDSEIYGYVDLGTRPHIIRPKRAKKLRFGAGSSPKTQPNVIGSTGGGEGGAEVYANVVSHPGTAPRNFTKSITKEVKPYFRRYMQEAIAKAAKASGHSI